MLKRLSGDVSFGSNYAKGNDTAQYNVGLGTTLLYERWAASLNANSSLASSTGTNTTTRNTLELSGYHLLRRENWFAGGLTSFLQSSVQGIDLQTSVGAGIGRFLKNTSRFKASLLGGLAWQRTDYQTSVVTAPSQDVIAALAALNLSLFQFKKTSLRVNGNMLPALSDPGRVRFGTNITYYLKVWGDLNCNFSFYGNWDNKPPPGFAGSDYGSTAGLSWSFGND
jgi:hypothetical protein